MSMRIVIVHVGLFSLLLGSLKVIKSVPCQDDRCRTGSCDATGACICDLPDPSTILDGDRAFLGGHFCDERMTMCDGTNSFWCEHGGICEEIVQGENYRCRCPPGYVGEHCEHSGVPCGKIFCFHQAECLLEDESCGCPPDWKGSFDCSLPTMTKTDFSTNSTKTSFPQVGSWNHNRNWIAAVLASSFSVGAIAGFAIYGKKLCGKKDSVRKFRQLPQENQTQGGDDDEVDSLVPGVLSHNDNPRL